MRKRIVKLDKIRNYEITLKAFVISKTYSQAFVWNKKVFECPHKIYMINIKYKFHENTWHKFIQAVSTYSNAI
jgi:hypothetical protein